MLWTAPRAERWQETGEVPAKVMVWTAAHCGAFPDSVEGQRLYALFHVAAYFGLRRSELIGLTWSEVDLAQRRIYVRQSQVDDVLDSTKSEDSERVIVIDQGTVDVLRAWRKAQLAERMAWRPAWQDTGRLFTREDGTRSGRAWCPSGSAPSPRGPACRGHLPRAETRRGDDAPRRRPADQGHLRDPRPRRVR